MTDAEFLRDVVVPVCASIPDRKDRILAIADKLENPVTVRPVFERAFGPIPEGATGHLGYKSDNEDSYYMIPTLVALDGTMISGKYCYLSNQMKHEALGQDILSCPAEPFRGLLGPDYDKALDELLAERGSK